ncbi:imidazolonepropionase [Proteiniborus sp. MB09-C3]|uniref:imidazolonepropionase n=1 Tax=Proteiniborus sp. MB09-C3 TaxID=3050072 RepID=UPI0025524B13|nr:imidazolonepropionase [Proteiniborus sp. MB09-C3]WIV10504.1 imidazolonepropionase [Proteiniborus sp. MB09-C3]
MKADIVIENISQLVTMEGPDRPRIKEEMKNIGLIENGIVAIAGDKIIFVGEGKIPSYIEIGKETIIIDGAGKTVTPGLVDPHTHLVHGGSRENELAMKLNGMKYLDILKAGGGILSTVKATQNASFEELYKKAEKSLNTMLEFGITTVEAKSGYGLNTETELKQLRVAKELNEKHPVDIVSTFMGAHAVPKEYKDNPEKFVEIIINDMIPKVAEERLAEFCDVFCEEGVFTVDQTRRILNAAREHGMLPKVHADEIEPLGGAELAAEVEAVSADHLVAASEAGMKMMAEKGVIADLLPATSFNLASGKFADARKMIELGVPVALSTDYNPGSSPTENLQLAMYFASLILRMTPEEVFTAVTINSACSLRKEKAIGSIRKGKKADIIIFDSPNINYIIYHFGINHVDMVVKNGKIVVEKGRKKGAF